RVVCPSWGGGSFAVARARRHLTHFPPQSGAPKMYFPFYPIPTAIFIVVVIGVTLGLCAYFILIERKIAAWTQDRIGPNRVGPFGLLQPIADGVKFLLKEDVIPDHVAKLFYILAPAIALS